MPRITRIDIGNYCYHVINRANARLPIFFKEEDYVLFEKVLEKAQEKFSMRILAYILMPNHFHFVLYPLNDGDMGKFMQWLTLTHTQRWHQAKKTKGTGHLYQGRYKSFIIEEDDHLFAVIRYVEQNAIRAKIVKRAENWKFSSLWRRMHLNNKQKNILSTWPIPEPQDYILFVNTTQTKEEVENIRKSVSRGRPYGTDDWTSKMIRKFNLESTVRVLGRPKKGT